MSRTVSIHLGLRDNIQVLGTAHHSTLLYRWIESEKQELYLTVMHLKGNLADTKV